MVLSGQGEDITTRVQVTRDGTEGKSDATYLLVYLSAPADVTLGTSVLAAPALKLSWFNPQTGEIEIVQTPITNNGSLKLEKRPQGVDWVAIVEPAA